MIYRDARGHFTKAPKVQPSFPQNPTYLLRTCDKNLKAYGGFQYPEKGYVEAPDWKPKPVCGNGLHGLLMGKGNQSLLNWDESEIWQILAVDPKTVAEIDVEFDGGKAKVPYAWVVLTGTRKEATDFLLAHGASFQEVPGIFQICGDNEKFVGGVKAVLAGGRNVELTGENKSHLTGQSFAKLTGGDESVLFGKERSVLKGGDYCALIGGNDSQLSGGKHCEMSSGNDSVLTGGDFARMRGGSNSFLTGGYGSTLEGGDFSTLVSGESSVLISGYKSTFKAGSDSTFVAIWTEGSRWFLVQGRTNGTDLKPDVTYKINPHNQKFEEVVPKT